MTIAHRRPALGRAGTFAMLGLVIIALAAGAGPWVWPHDPLAQHVDQRLAPLSRAHPLGTDQFGRDVLARMLVGGRWSLLGAAVVCIGTTAIGFVLGAAAAVGPRWLDHMISRTTEIFQSVPSVLLALTFAALLSPSFENLLVALVLTNWTWYARMYRALLVQEVAMPYIEGAHATGVGTARLLTRHMLPNILGPLLVVATINFGTVILNLSALSFIGFGLPPPTPEWGNLINESKGFFQRAPLLMIAPGMCIIATVLCVNIMGNALRDWVDAYR